MAVLYTPHFIQFLDDNGDPLSGGKLYSYEAGTTTPKDTYTNAGGGTANANPVVLDSSGRATVFLSGAYKFRLEDADGNLIEETDNVTAFSVQSATVDDITGNFTEDTAVAADSFLFSDASDSDDTKRDTIQRLIDLSDASVASAMSGALLNGLTLSNNSSDATNDIDIAAGAAVSDDGTTFIALGSGITKRLDASWAVGTGNGGLDTGSIADTTYFVWLIKRPDTGVVDVLFSTSASSPTMPSNYTKKKRIGAIIRSSSAILAFIQAGKEFILSNAVIDLNAQNPGTSAVTRTLTVPVGVKVIARVVAGFYPGSTAGTTYLSSLDGTDQAPQAALTASLTGVGSTSDSAAWSLGPMTVLTNASAQIRSRVSISGANDRIGIITLGWIDYQI